MNYLSLLCTSFLFLIVRCDNLDEDEVRRRILVLLSLKESVMMPQYELISRVSTLAVHRFKSYRNVATIVYPIPKDVSVARFFFHAENLHLNSIGSCDVEDVIIDLKHSSYPAVNPDGYSFPENFIDHREQNIHSIVIKSDRSNNTYYIDSPQYGQWYAVAYLKWEDPMSQKVTQQGLAATCQVVLYTDLQIKRQEPEQINCYSQITIDMTEKTRKLYSCVIRNSEEFRLDINLESSQQANVSIKIQSGAIPSYNNTILSCYLTLPMYNQSIYFMPSADRLHYIEFEIIESSYSMAECESYSLRSHEDLEFKVYDLMRDDKGYFFSYDYMIPARDLQDPISTIGVSSNEVVALKFNIQDFLDVGGTLQLSASLIMSLKYYMGFRRLFTNGTLLKFSKYDPFMRLVICNSVNYISVPQMDGNCKFNNVMKPSLFVLNSTDSHSIDSSVFIPYPESGDWYISMRLFCDECVCPCLSDNQTYYVETDRFKGKRLKHVIDRSDSEYTMGTNNCSVRTMVAISSTPCVNGKCANDGTCVFSLSSGHIMSVCSCPTGYGAWDCSDASRRPNRSKLLLSALLLTLSNLVFMLSIYVAVIRLYYIEAMMFTFTMVLSTFYHACDQSKEVAYCITNVRILQYGDFYCGIMSFCVTILAISIINDTFRRCMQLGCAVIVALLTTWNMQALSSFVMPVTVTGVIMVLSWMYHFKKHRLYYFPKIYYKYYLPLGLILVGFGLVCYTSLQTEKNYMIVHSIWHVAVALSVSLLLPDYKRSAGMHSFKPSQKFSTNVSSFINWFKSI